MIRRTGLKMIVVVAVCISTSSSGLGQKPKTSRLDPIENGPSIKTAIRPRGKLGGQIVIPAQGPERGITIGPNRPIPPYSGFLGSQTGNLSVDWVTPESFVVGQEGDFELVLQNRGPVAVEHITIEPVLPDDFQLIKAVPEPDGAGERPSWRVEQLGPQEEARIGLRLIPGSVGTLQGHARVSFRTTSVASFRVVEPKLMIEIAGPKSVVVGNQAVFNVVVSNPGSGKTTNTKLNIHLPEELVPAVKGTVYGLGVLNPGESRSIRVVANVSQLGNHACRFVATADHDLRDEARKEVVGLGAKLELAINGPEFRYVTRPARYTVGVKNSGTAPAENVQLRCAVPKPFAFLDAEQAGSFDASSKNVNWLLGQLAPGQETKVTFTLRALAPGDFPILAHADAERGHHVQSRHTIRVEGIAAILLEVVDVDDPVEVGAETMYEILITNQGTEFAKGVRITATVPEGIEIIGSQGPSPGIVQDRTIRFAAIPKLAPRADAIYRVKVSGTKPGDFRIEVHAMAETLDSPVTELESTKIYQD